MSSHRFSKKLQDWHTVLSATIRLSMGTKRIGAHAMLVFLELNGIVLEYSQNELSDLFLSVAASNQNYEDILRWLLLHEQND